MKAISQTEGERVTSTFASTLKDGTIAQIATYPQIALNAVWQSAQLE